MALFGWENRWLLGGRFFSVGVVCFCLALPGEAAEGLDHYFPPGKPSIDFFSAKVTSDEIVGGNLARFPDISAFSPAADAVCRNTWSIPATGDALKMARSLIRHSYSPETGAVIEIPLAAETADGGKENRGVFSQTVALPARAKPVKFLFRVEARGENAPGAKVAPRMFARLTPLDAKGESLRSANRDNLVSFETSGDWRRYEKRLSLPPECAFARISLHRVGAGKGAFRGVGLFSLSGSDDITVTLSPMGFYDNEFHISSGGAGRPDILLANPSRSSPLSPRLTLTLPPGVRLDAVGIPFKSSPIALANSWDIDLSLMAGNERAVLSLLLFNAMPEGARGEAIARYRDADKTSEESRFTIVSTRGQTAKSPKRFQSAIATGGVLFPTGTDLTALADLTRRSGVNAIREADGFSPEAAAFFRRDGIRVYKHSGSFCNGYRLGSAKKPEAAIFRGVDGKPFGEGKGVPGICPQEIIENGTTYRAALGAVIAQLGENGSADGLMSNWEPYFYDFKGCFCDRCERAFAEFAKVPKGELDKIWPKEVMTIRRDEWRAFRSHQHAKALARIDADFRRQGLEFIPMLAAPGLTGLPDDASALYRSADYLPLISAVAPWGPYQTVTAGEKYVYIPGWLWAQNVSAKRIRANVDAVAAAAGTTPPRLLAAPHAAQSRNWVTPAEALAFQFMIYFVNRWDGAVAYYFPHGYDQRYWNALAGANRQIAAYEDFLAGAEPVEDIAVTALTETPVSGDALSSRFPEFPELRGKLPSLQAFAFRKNGGLLVAVGNFWQLGEAFFQLRISSLDATSRHTVLSGEEEARPLLFLSPSGNDSWSGEELAKEGLIAQTGAWRFRFFRVVRSGAIPENAVRVSREATRRLMEKRLPDIRQAMERERSLTSAAIVRRELPSFSAAGVTATPAADASGEWVIKTAKACWRLAPERGAALTSWRIDGKELARDDAGAAVAGDGFQRLNGKNTFHLKGAFALEGVEIKDGVSRVKFRRVLSPEDHAALDGLKITRAYAFSADSPGFTLEIELENIGTAPMSTRYSQINMFRALERVAGEASCRMPGAEFKREFEPKLFRLGAEDPEFEGAFAAKNVKSIQGARANFPNFTVSCGPEKDFLGFVFWDRGHLPVSTFEPVFRKHTLNPGENVRYVFRFENEKINDRKE